MKNKLTKEQNNRRYKLHQIIKTQYRYHPKTKIVEIDEVKRGVASPKVEQALRELQTRFRYSLQTAIPIWKVGDKVRIHPRFEKPTEEGKFYEIVGISGKKATIKRYTGRWRKPFEIQINLIIPI